MSDNGERVAESDTQEPPKSRTRLAVVSAAIGLVVVVLAIAFVIGRSTDRTSTAADASSSAAASSVVSTASSASSTSSAASGSASTSTPTVEAQSSVPATAMSGQPGLPAPTAVQVLVTSSLYLAGTQELEVVSSVTGVATTTGSCTAVAVLGSATTQASGTATFNGRGTSCGSIMIPMQGQPKGNWSIHVEFSFTGGVAKSEPVTVVVQ